MLTLGSNERYYNQTSRTIRTKLNFSLSKEHVKVIRVSWFRVKNITRRNTLICLLRTYTFCEAEVTTRLSAFVKDMPLNT